jgi:hypothetical protein
MPSTSGSGRASVDPARRPQPDALDDRDSEQARQEPWLRLSLPRRLVEELIEDGRLCAAQLHCLDAAAKQAIQRICLERCARHMHCTDATLPLPAPRPLRRR